MSAFAGTVIHARIRTRRLTFGSEDSLGWVYTRKSGGWKTLCSLPRNLGETNLRPGHRDEVRLGCPGPMAVLKSSVQKGLCLLRWATSHNTYGCSLVVLTLDGQRYGTIRQCSVAGSCCVLPWCRASDPGMTLGWLMVFPHPNRQQSEKGMGSNPSQAGTPCPFHIAETVCSGGGLSKAGGGVRRSWLRWELR